MSAESALLLERMGTAVRTAYQAIEVLKKENAELKSENERLKKDLLSLQPKVSESANIKAALSK